MAKLGEQAPAASAAMLGMSVEQVQELGYAAKLAGTDSESFNQSMVRFERNIAEAQKGRTGPPPRRSTAWASARAN